MSDQLNAGVTSKSTRTLMTIHNIYLHKAKMIRMIMIANDIRELWERKLPGVCLDKNPEETSPRELVPTGDRTRASCVAGADVAACSTAVDIM